MVIQDPRKNAGRFYIAIDIKSFYASVECRERGLDPLRTHLVVADASRTEKTICLAVTPSLKAYGLSGRSRLFEVVQRMKKVNEERRCNAPEGRLIGSSCDAVELKEYPELAADYLTAPPRMARYIEVSTEIYRVYLKYIAPEDIHVYSIDEVFMDVTSYLKTYGMNARQLAKKIILDVLETTGMTATAGIGTNLYLCKIAMDIEAKHTAADEDGVCIAELDEMSYRRKLWTHRPLTDFWRIGKGYTRKLEAHGLYTMGDVARCSLGKRSDYHNGELLYKLFGVNAELLIDHAWGREPCTMSDIKSYRPENTSIASGQVLQSPYTNSKARLVLREMTEMLALDLTEKRLTTNQLVLTVGYDIENLSDPERRQSYRGEVTVDPYGRRIPKHAHGTVNLKQRSASSKQLTDAVLELYDRITDKTLTVRRLNLSANRILPEGDADRFSPPFQPDLFSGSGLLQEEQESGRVELEREKKLQETAVAVKKRFGKNALLKGSSLEEGATARERNRQIGGHKA